MQVPHTHDRPLSQVIYNKELHQVITVCTESFVKVWEAETGKLVYQITEAHGSNVEVTAIGIDKTGYRLVTGAIDGTLLSLNFYIKLKANLTGTCLAKVIIVSRGISLPTYLLFWESDLLIFAAIEH